MKFGQLFKNFVVVATRPMFMEEDEDRTSRILGG